VAYSLNLLDILIKKLIMTRIKFIVFYLIIFLIVSSCYKVDKPAYIENGYLRNVVVIIGDDHANGVLGSLGNDIIQTPNLDKLSHQGIIFSNAFANSPLCSASRQSLLTGKYPHSTGVTLLTTSFPEDQVTIADHLAKFEFQSAIIGKNHFNNNLNHGFDLKIDRNSYSIFLNENPSRKAPDSIKTRPPWKPFKDHARVWLNSETLPSEYYDEESRGTFYASQAINFIKENKENRFFLWLGFNEPHSPFDFPIEYGGKYNKEEMTLPVGSQEDDEFIPLVFEDLTKEERKGIIASYYTSVEYLDKNIGKVLEAIEKEGLIDNTLVIYLGDHGYLLNDHKRFEKHMMWEEAVKAPLIIRAGNHKVIEAVRPELVEFVDVAPTIIDFLGVDPMTEVQGNSLKPFFYERDFVLHDMVFSEFLADNKAMVRTRKWKYIFTSGKHDLAQGYATGNPPGGIRHRLYNLEVDPKETKDISNQIGNRKVLEGLQRKMIDVFEETHPFAQNIPAGLSIEQQLSWYCEPPDFNPDMAAK